MHELWWSLITRTPRWVRRRRERQRVEVRAALARAVIHTPEGWLLACPYHRERDGLDALADSIVEAIS